MKLKHFLFRWNLQIAMVSVVAVIVFAIFNSESLHWQTYLTVVGGILYFVYYLQKQSLEEAILFRDLFRDFNERYDEMNEDLNRLLTKKTLTKRDNAVVIDYFNLCAEESLMNERGYIYPEVWRAWQNGMNVFFSDPKIRQLWDSEKESNSYYGFKWD